MLNESKISNKIENKEEQEKIDIAEIINNLRAKRDELEENTIKKQGKDTETNYIKKRSKKIIDNFEKWQESEAGKYLIEKLKDSLIVDFGCGQAPSVCHTINLLSKLDIKGYVGVDPNWAPWDERTIEYFKKGSFGLEGDLTKAKEFVQDKEKYLTLGSDILTVLKELPDECCHIIMNGIDSTIVSNMSEDYVDSLKKEIERVVNKEGLVFGAGYILDKKLLGEKFKHNEEFSIIFQIYEKIQEEKNAK